MSKEIETNSLTEILGIKVYMTPKIVFCLFERPSKIQKNGVFSLWNIFFRFRDIDVFLLWKLISNDVTILQLKSGKKNWINDISGNIKAVLLKLGTANVHHKTETKWHRYCCCPDNSFATGAVLNKNWNSQLLS